MPIYEYECSHCHHRFEVKQSFNDKPQAKCPKCREAARRVFHPTPIIFRGSGFYVTDHRPASKEKGAESGKKDKEPKSSQGETKASQSSK
jgi:putative FmdB family regulatory protein